MFLTEEEYRKIIETMPILCVDVIVRNNDRFLMLKRDNEPAKGEYWFPGGRVHKMESIADAAVRKVKGETNIECRFEKIVSVEETIFEKGSLTPNPVHTVNVCCLAEAVDVSALNTDKLHSAAKWFDHIDNNWHAAVQRPLRLLGYSNHE